LGYDPTQIHRIVDATEAHLLPTQEETEQATEALKQVQKVVIEKHRVAQQDKVSLQTKFEEEKAQIQQEKEKLLSDQFRVKEGVNKELRSMTGLEQKEEELIELQVAEFAKAIQQLQ
jgi:hypothetical protein